MDFAVVKFDAKGSRPAQAMALLRVLMGVCFCYAGYSKWQDPMFSAHLPSLLKGWAQANPVFIYQDVMSMILVPQASALAHVVMWLEMAIGAALFLGLGMRYVVGAQLFLLLNYLAASQHAEPTLLVINVLFMVLGLLCLWGQAGLYYGLDSMLIGLGKPKGTKRKKNTRKGSVRTAKKRLKNVVALEPLMSDDDDEDDFDWNTGDDDEDDEDIDLPVRRRGRRRAGAR